MAVKLEEWEGGRKEGREGGKEEGREGGGANTPV